MPGPGGGGRSGGGGRGGFSGGSRGGGFSGGRSSGGSRGGSFGGGHPGGGFHGGGSFGGGHPGGGFHGGGHHGGFHGGPPMGGGWHFGPRRHYSSGGGCCGGFVGMLAIGLFIFFFIIYLMLPAGNTEITFGDTDGYDEELFQDYANSQYEKEFGRTDAYEDNLLITVLVEDEEYYNFYYIAWVGDHIETDINWMLGGNDTELGQAMSSSISETSYKYSLDSNLAQVVYSLADEIQALNLESSFICDEDHVQVKSHLTNHSRVDMTEETVNDALTAFTDATGIPIVIVVEDMDAVFGSTKPAEMVSGGPSGHSSSFGLVGILIVGAVIVIVVTVFVNRRKKTGNELDDGGNDSRYKDFDF